MIKEQGKISLRSELKERFIEWCNYSTTHGIPNIARSDSKTVKLIWFVCLSAGSVYCFYSIVTILISFLSFGVLINIEVVEKAPIEFPAVTVCNLNPLDRRYSQSYIDEVLSKHNISHVKDTNRIDINPHTVKYLIKANILADKNLTWQQIRQFGFEIDFMLLTCFYNDKPCNASDFVWVYDFDFGNCFTFNSGNDQKGNKVPIRLMNEPGSDRSFKLELFLGDEFSQGIWMQQSGARVIVHNQSVEALIEAEGKELATNYQTDIGITRTFVSKLEYPYSNCVKNIYSPDGHKSEYFKAMFNILNMTTYRQKNCIRLCVQKFIKDSCGCVDPKLPNIYKSVPYCATLSLLNCISNSRIEYLKKSDECKECPLECDSVDYQLRTSKSRYPTMYYTNYLRYQTDLVSRFPLTTVVSDNHIQKNIVLLNVFYDDLATTYVHEIQEVSADALFGTIGGNLGLFIGMSLLSFVEILEILIEVVLICLKKRRNNNQLILVKPVKF
ncbi:unnamed protein product [Brachionus calyciflorus]|uniref:Uncharacterized protein n=1 Tax=Brachionus calyciflorus TaxID=104777 RepID=A0A813LX93_9BILA|nr:unnamed protein product [Brachionus calyciflorus]